MKRASLLACMVLIAGLQVNIAFAETYCVDADNGSDNNSGICNADVYLPWASLEKANGITFLPGDSLLLKRGNTWNSRIYVNSYGDPGTEYEPLTIDAYGNPGDELPIIDVEGKWESAFVGYRSYTTVKNLQLRNSTNNVMGFAINGGAIGITIDSVKIDRTLPGIGNNGISFPKGGDNILITNVEVRNMPNNGIIFSGHPTDHIGNVVLENSHVTGPGSYDTGNDCITIHEGPSQSTAGSGFIFRNNIAENCSEQGFDITTGSNVTLSGNVSRNNGAGGVTVGRSAENVTITHHTSYDEPVLNTAAAINIGTRNVTLKNSIIMGTGYHMVRATKGINFPGKNINIINNTFVWARQSSLFDIEQVDSINVENNIFVTARQNFSNCILRFLDSNSFPDKPAINFNYNLYYSPNDDLPFCVKDQNNTALNGNFDLNTFRTKYRQEANGISSNPALVNLDLTNPDFHLSSLSPAIDTGNPSYNYDLEPENGGNRINIGRYGNTPEAAQGLYATAEVNGANNTTSASRSGNTISAGGGGGGGGCSMGRPGNGPATAGAWWLLALLSTIWKIRNRFFLQ